MQKFNNLKIYEISIVALFTSLIIVGAYIKIPFPLVPLTLQTLFVYLAGMLLKPKIAGLSVLLYIFLGLVGLPVFSKGGGIFYFLEPTFGYIIGFFFSAWLISTLIKYTKTKKFFLQLLIGIAGIFTVYLFGMIYLYFIMNYYTNTPIAFWGMFSFNFLMTIFGDILKILVAILVARRLKYILKSSKYFQAIINH